MIDPYWIRNTDETIRDLHRASDGVAMIPLGSIESHGPHLPLGCDPIKTDNLVKNILKHETVATLPTLHYSYNADARMLPGAISIRSDILMDYVENICDEVYRNGFSKIVLLHGHGGNVSLHQMFGCRMLEREKPYVTYSLSAQPGPVWEEMKKDSTDETPEWGHACEWETSMMYLADEKLVTLEKLNGRTYPSAGALPVGHTLTPVDWVAKYPMMAVGKPHLASKEKGEKFMAAVVAAIVKHLRLIKADTRTAAVMKSYVERTRTVSGERR